MCGYSCSVDIRWLRVDNSLVFRVDSRGRSKSGLIEVYLTITSLSEIISRKKTRQIHL